MLHVVMSPSIKKFVGDEVFLPSYIQTNHIIASHNFPARGVEGNWKKLAVTLKCLNFPHLSLYIHKTTTCRGKHLSIMGRKKVIALGQISALVMVNRIA